MAEKRKARKKKEELDDKPTKEEYAVAKYLRTHLPVKKTTLLSHKVEYFIASKAIDSLLDSQWSSNRKGKNAIFTSRESVVEYLNTMLIHKFFHRAKKITVSQKELKAKKKSKTEREDESSHAEDTKEKKSVKRKEKDKSKDQEEKKEEKKESSADGNKDKKKEKRKIKLDMHLEQVFLDGNEAYVWIYDPIPTTAWLIGGLLVVGAILLCLFPLWPSSVRKGVYYISIAAAGFLCVIVALIFARIVIFCLIWALTFGRHHLWILPNLTEDVGFFESFWPLYKYEYKGSDNGEGQEEKEKQKKKKKAKDSDDEDNKDKKQGSETEKDNTEKDSDKEATDSDRESEDSREQNRRDSANGDNGFEMVTQDDVEREEDSGNSSKKHSGVMPVAS